MEGGTRRRAGCLYREARSVEIEQLRKSVGETETFPAAIRPEGAPGTRVRAVSVVAIHDTGENARARLVRPAHRPCVFERRPRDFQEQPQLWVHHLGLARRHAE